MEKKLVLVNILIIDSSLQSVFKQKGQTFAMMVNEESLGLGLLIGQKKQIEDVTFGSGELMSVFQFYRLND